MIIEVSDLWVKLGRVEVLRRVEVTISMGESIALIGRNGADKTALLRTLISIIKPYKGFIRIKLNSNTLNVVKLKPYMVVRMSVGYVGIGI